METTHVPSLESDRLLFTPLQIENIYTHFRWNNDPELNRLDSELPHREEPFGQFKKRFEQMCFHTTEANRDFEIHLKGDALIGVAYVSDISAHHGHAQIGITIGDREHWGQGYGRESLELLLAYCFDELDLHRVSAETFEYNQAWRRLVEEAGFVHEGSAREYLQRDGQYWDKVNYALLAHEYHTRNTALAENVAV